MPLNARTGCCSMKFSSLPGRTTVRPFGLSMSDASFATALVVPTPIEHDTPSSATRFWILRAIETGCSRFTDVGVTSRKASSMLTCCIRGVSSRNMFMTAFDISRYRSKCPTVHIASGQSRSAVDEGMADRTPNLRASYEHVDTTPLLFELPPTMTGFPRQAGWSSCSTEAKKASRSTRRIAGPSQGMASRAVTKESSFIFSNCTSETVIV